MSSAHRLWRIRHAHQPSRGNRSSVWFVFAPTVFPPLFPWSARLDPRSYRPSLRHLSAISRPVFPFMQSLPQSPYYHPFAFALVSSPASRFAFSSLLTISRASLPRSTLTITRASLPRSTRPSSHTHLRLLRLDHRCRSSLGHRCMVAVLVRRCFRPRWAQCPSTWL